MWKGLLWLLDCQLKHTAQTLPQLRQGLFSAAVQSLRRAKAMGQWRCPHDSRWLLRRFPRSFPLAYESPVYPSAQERLPLRWRGQISKYTNSSASRSIRMHARQWRLPLKGKICYSHEKILYSFAKPRKIKYMYNILIHAISTYIYGYADFTQIFFYNVIMCMYMVYFSSGFRPPEGRINARRMMPI